MAGDLTPEQVARRKELIHTRGTIKTRITKLKKYLIESGVYAAITYTEKHYNIICQEMEAMPDMTRELQTLEPDVDHAEVYDTMEDEVEELRVLVHKLKEPGLEFNPAATLPDRNRTGTPVSVGAHSYARSYCGNYLQSLPKMEAKKFDGKLENWRAYRDWFIAIIHQNEILTDAQRLDYLKRTCEGEASETIRAFQATDENYSVAWGLLEKTYDIEYILVLRHCDLLMETPHMKKNTPDEIKKVLNHIQTQILAMKALGQNVDAWNTLLVHLLLRRMDKETAREWNRKMQGNKLPQFEDLLTFLREESTRLTSMTSNFPAATSRSSTIDTSANGKQKNAKGNNNTPRTQTLLTNTVQCCPQCKGQHTFDTCEKVLSLAPLDRIQAARTAELCLNCLQKGHKTRVCKADRCSTCKKRHHTRLHLNDEEAKVMRAAHDAKTIALVATLPSRECIITAVVYILDSQQKPIRCRAILDTAAGTNFMTESLANKLGLSREKLTMKVEGLNDATTASNSLVSTTIQSRLTSFRKSLNFLTVENIGRLFPMEPVDKGALQIPKNIALADPLFDRPAPVDILISVGTTLSMLCQGQIRLNNPNDPDVILQQTQLGWILGGNPLAKPSHHNSSAVQCNLTTDSEFDVQKFWELEEIPGDRHISQEEQFCEKHFQDNITRDSTGRYIVALPFNEKKAALCNTHHIAEARLKSLQRKFLRNPELEKQYSNVLQEYIDLGHMSEIQVDPKTQEGFYLPHHAVIKTTSLTTKVRVVFNASAKTSPTAVSLNDALMTGPTIQDDIFSLLLRFRSHQYVLTADIEKMYRQFIVRDEDRKFQRILWKNAEGETKTYELNTVTFGVASAPYLAIRCLHQLADDESEDFPEAASRIKRDLYVDDLLTGTDSYEAAVNLRNDIDALLKRGGLNLRQWASNDPRLLENLPEGSVNLQLQADKDATIKTLGVHWDSQRDAIVYTVKPITTTSKVTKRSLLSDLAKIFDPLGLLGPIIVKGKIIMQSLWKEKLDWDDPVPLSVHTEWKSYTAQLSLLNNESFNRKIIITDVKEIQLHGFCDASEKAYGACIYLKTIDTNGSAETQLLCAKSRVAPIKSTTLPRLELCSALLLADLYQATKKSISHEFDRTFFWSDSMVALHWIKTPPHKLLVFVANRVSGIQEKTRGGEWRHVRTHDNPADHVSRGLTSTEFIENSLWKNGPSWLNQNESSWPTTELLIPAEIPELRKVQCLVVSPKIDFWNHYSSIGHLRRIVALCLRFKNKKQGPISVEELKLANERIVKLVQAEAFPDEIKELEKGGSLSPKHKLKSLSPFLDEDGLIRVGGRLGNAQIPYAQQHPLLLPKTHHISTLLIRNEHLSNFHSGNQTTLYSLRTKYWILDARGQVRKVIRECTKCIRAKPPNTDYVMASLPRVRVTQAKPFINVGVDYCGPFLLKEKKHRNRGSIKAWVAVFVCMTVKAVHLEVVSDLTTEGFMAALKRFIARRGKPLHIYSDNGSNFIGADREIKELYTLLQSNAHNEIIEKQLGDKGIIWHFIPPLSPHFGGLWEAGVKSFKHHLKRISDTLVTYEEFNSLVIEIEAILNSRPLTPISTDPNDLLVLTPGHFLTGDALTSLPEPEWDSTRCNRLSAWQLIQKKQQEFWKRWYKEYLNEQIARTKWTTGVHQIKEGAIVILREDNLPPRHWALGRVIEVYPGSDGIIRTVKVKTAKGEFDRNVRKLAPLLVEQKSE